MSAKDEIIKKAESIGSTMLSLLWPREFECYMVAFELCSGTGETLEYFTFPIMPNFIQIDETPIVRITNTFGGISVVSSNAFAPKSISLRGNFGRNFKILNRGDAIKSLTVAFKKEEVERSYGRNASNNKSTELSYNLKTGYGCTKVLQSILNRSLSVDSVTGEINRLYFYNLAFGESFLVKAINYKFSQSMENNMMWDYDLSLKAVCPIHLDKYKSGSSAKKIFGMGAIQQTTNSLVNSLRI